MELVIIAMLSFSMSASALDLYANGRWGAKTPFEVGSAHGEIDLLKGYRAHYSLVIYGLNPWNDFDVLRNLTITVSGRILPSSIRTQFNRSFGAWHQVENSTPLRVLDQDTYEDPWDAAAISSTLTVSLPDLGWIAPDNPREETRRLEFDFDCEDAWFPTVGQRYFLFSDDVWFGDKPLENGYLQVTCPPSYAFINVPYGIRFLTRAAFYLREKSQWNIDCELEKSSLPVRRPLAWSILMLFGGAGLAAIPVVYKRISKRQGL